MFTEEGLSVLILSPILAFPARQASAERVSRVLHPLNLLPVCHTMASSSPKATFCFTACLMLSRCVSRGLHLLKRIPLLPAWHLAKTDVYWPLALTTIPSFSWTQLQGELLQGLRIILYICVVSPLVRMAKLWQKQVAEAAFSCGTWQRRKSSNNLGVTPIHLPKKVISTLSA